MVFTATSLVFLIYCATVISSAICFSDSIFSSPRFRFDIHAVVDNNDNFMDRHGFIKKVACWAAISSTTSSTTAAATTTAASGGDCGIDNTNTNYIEAICKNGALMDENSIPGAYSTACMMLTERTIILPKFQERCRSRKEYQDFIDRVDGTIVIQQKVGGSGNTGMTVWNSGLLMTRLLDCLTDELERIQRQRGQRENDSFWSNQDVFELGTGTGICSIAAYRLGARSIIATDGNPGVLELAESNIRRNCYDYSSTTTTTTTTTTTRTDTLSSSSNYRPLPPSSSLLFESSLMKIKTKPLQWGFLNAMDYNDCASFVIGSDLTYNPGSWRVLAETIATVLKTKNEQSLEDDSDVINKSGSSSTRCYALYLSIGHEGFNVNAEMDGFLSVCNSSGLINIPDGVEGIDVSELLLNSLSESEKSILAQSGGFRVAVLGHKEAG